MPDSWEEKYSCLNKNKDDAIADSDNDGLINIDEYRYGTDPCNADTDGDGFKDKEEIDAGTDPLNAKSYPVKKEEDNDKDGMPDSYELKHACLNKDINDASKDSDNDGLKNIEEYRYGTDPCDPDTDKDGFTDKVETDKGTNPLDKDSYPKSRWWLWTLIIVIGLGGLSYIGYFGYSEYKKKVEVKEEKKRTFAVPKTPVEIKKGKELFKERIEAREKEREKLFEEFAPKHKLHEIDVFEKIPKKEQEDIFKKLPGEEDIFKRLPKVEDIDKLRGDIFEQLPKPKEKKNIVRKKYGKRKRKKR